MNLAYDVEADWTLLGTCSFRCSYCFSSDATRSARIRVHASAEQWSAGFDATGKTWLLHVNGGEPSLYPDFPELFIHGVATFARAAYRAARRPAHLAQRRR